MQACGSLSQCGAARQRTTMHAMKRWPIQIELTGHRIVTAQSLSVAPDWVGRRLATPRRRLVAMAIDLLVVALVSSASNAWLLAAGALAAWGLLRRGGTVPTARPRWLAPVGAALLLIGAVDAWRLRVARPRLGEPDTAAVAARSLATTASGLSRAASSPERDEAWSQAASEAALEAMAARMQALEAEVKQLRGTPPDWRERAAEWLDSVGLGYGGALL